MISDDSWSGNRLQRSGWVHNLRQVLASGIITLYDRFLTQLQGRGGANLKIGECEIGLAE